MAEHVQKPVSPVDTHDITNSSAASSPPKGLWGNLSEQLGMRQMISEYMIPVETNSIWYTLGGVLAISLVLEIITGMLLSFQYVPDAGKAYSITYDLLHSTGWSIVLNFHYFNAFVIFALVMIHMVRVFISGCYKRGKQGLWFIGVILAGLTLLVSITGESLHWDEVGFAVPWHMSEAFQATHLANTFHYTFKDLLNVQSATTKLSQIYALHIAIGPIILLLFIVMHYYLIRMKGISAPFWQKASGMKASFGSHIREWLIYGSIVTVIVLALAIFINRDPGVAPQLIPSSPLFGLKGGPGHFGAKPSFPISWTHGMNEFVKRILNFEPDIWGTIDGAILMTGALFLIPFVDRSDREPATAAEAFNMRKRGIAFALMALFWIIMIVGVVANALAPHD